MSDGKLNFVIHGLELTEKQEKKMRQKVEKLLKFDASVSSVDVNIRKREEAGAAISVEIRLNAKGEFFASKESPTFEEALDGAVDAIHKQLEKRWGKRTQNKGEDLEII